MTGQSRYLSAEKDTGMTYARHLHAKHAIRTIDMSKLRHVSVQQLSPMTISESRRYEEGLNTGHGWWPKSALDTRKMLGPRWRSYGEPKSLSKGLEERHTVLNDLLVSLGSCYLSTRSTPTLPYVCSSSFRALALHSARLLDCPWSGDLTIQ